MSIVINVPGNRAGVNVPGGRGGVKGDPTLTDLEARVTDKSKNCVCIV